MAIILVAPDAPPPSKPTTASPPSPITADHPLDRKLIELVSQQDGKAAPLWAVVHEVVEGQRPPGRPQRRQLIGHVLCRARALLHRGIIERVDKAHVRLAEPVKGPPQPPTLRPQPARNLPPAFPTGAAWGVFSSGGPGKRAFKA